MLELVLDSQIRWWVFFPLPILSFLEGILSHYVGALINNSKKLELKQVEQSQALLRVQMLRKNGHLLFPESYLMRKKFFLNSEELLVEKEKTSEVHKLMKDPHLMNDMVKGNFLKVVPMMISGGYINWMFSGFLTTKLPFPVPLRFKSMVQRDVDLETLSPSWVSSVSWYFLSMFGIRGIHALVLDNDYEDKFLEPMEFSQETNPDLEALKLQSHKWSLSHVDVDYMY